MDSMNLTEEWLNESHFEAISNFQCVDRNQDNHAQLFLQEQALKLMDLNLVRTRLFFDQSQIVV